LRKWAGNFLLVFIFAVALPMPVVWAKDLKPQKSWLKKELQKMGLSKEFQKLALQSYETESFETVLRLNLVGFLKPPQHMDHVTRQSVQESLAFIKENQKFFEMAEARYKVPPSVIAALLWIETRHGENLGTFHVLSVYLHLLQTNRPAVRQVLTQKALAENRRVEKFSSSRDLRKLMAERTHGLIAKKQWQQPAI
jgi:membrane-bound lytic murein transglycosylase B